MVEVLIPNTILNQSLLPRSRLTSESNYLSTVDMLYSADDEREFSPTKSTTSTEPKISDSEIRERVLRQVEWYFGDENLQKDSFLMKHIARNKQGLVSLKLVASLRKVKAITKDWRIVAESIKDSTTLEINEDGTKIRRIDPVPEIDYSCIPRTILITNYTNSNPELSQVQQEFSRYGTISRVQILHPGKAIPLDIKSCRSKFPSIGKELCLLIEYNSTETAKRVCRELNQNWRQTMSIHLLSSKDDVQTDHKEIQEEIGKRQRVTKVSNQKGVNSESPKTKQHKGKAQEIVSSRRLNTRHRTPNGYGSDSGYSASRSPSLSPKQSPAPSRRFFGDNQSTPLRLTLTSKVSPLVLVLRNPHGPDGTEGFHCRD